jgi:hypothetical protein
MEVKEAILRMIATDIQPFKIVEDEGFRNLITTLQPKFKLEHMPSRKYLTENMMPRLCSELKV